MKSRMSKKSKRRLVMICFLMLFCVGIIICSVLKDLIAIMDNKKQLSTLEQQYDNLLQEEQELNAEVTKLKDPDYVARYARETYYYSLPDEVIIKLK